MDRRFCLPVLFLVAILSSSLQTCEAQTTQNGSADMDALMAFKAAADGGTVLLSWNGKTDPCGRNARKPWLGIECNDGGRVDHVILNSKKLAGKKLNGTFPENTLGNLTELRILTLSDNSFSGSFPSDISNLGGLFQLWAQNSHFSGPFPNITTVFTLSHLDVSGNNLSGSIPDLSGLNDLTMLNLSDNSFSGQIPPELGRFPDSAFAGNPALCGAPMVNNPCPGASPGTNSGNGSTPPPPTANSSATSATGSGGRSKKLTTINILFISLGALVVFSIILFFVVKYLLKKGKRVRVAKKSSEKAGDDSVQVAMTSMGGGEGGDRSKLSFIDDSQHGYDLEDLLRASAEMLGKGSFGTAYKAVMESGMIVAVKRLRDVREMGKKEFDQQMEMLGRLRHPNLVPLRAFYYAKEEKLLIYDFMPNGSLFSLLHGSRGPGRTPLEWPARLSIAQGVALGLTYLHRESGHQKLPHGNIKSSNVLMGKNFEVCISDFGLVALMPSQIAAQRMAGYRAPEYNYAKKISYKADVYSFGVLLLELLTGQQPAQSINDNGIDLPRWVQSVVREEWTGEVFDPELKTYLHGEDEMVTLLQIAMSCVEPKPDERPEMASVVNLLGGIRRGDSMMDSESFQSHSTDGDYSSHDIGNPM